MPPDILPLPYQVLYILLPTVSVVGNGSIVYVTIRSKKLRTPCNVLIGLLSLADAVQSFSNYIFTIAYNFIDGHRVKTNICINLQLAPIFASCFSLVLLLNVAIDRLLSLFSAYEALVARHRKYYLAVHILPGCLFGVAMDLMVFFIRTSETEVICTPATVIQGVSYDVLIESIIIISGIVIICYLILLLLLRNIRLGANRLKSIYRSLIVISLAVIIGFFGAAIIVVISDALSLNIERFHLNLLAGVFNSFAISVTFFVYYAISTEYRNAFDVYLGIGWLKKSVCGKYTDIISPVVVISSTTSPRRSDAIC